MNPEYNIEQAATLLQTAIEERSSKTEEKTKAIYAIKVSIKFILEIYL